MRIILAAALALATLPGHALAQGDARVDSAIKQLLTSLVTAQRTFDQAAMNKLLAPDYIEISPIGEVDPRAKVLSFYAADKKVSDVPQVSLDEVSTRTYGETAVTIARLTYQMKGPNGAAASRAMRCVFVSRSTGGTWQLVSSQFTPIRN